MGVILDQLAQTGIARRTPHTHGGDSTNFYGKTEPAKYSPYSWG